MSFFFRWNLCDNEKSKTDFTRDIFSIKTSPELSKNEVNWHWKKEIRKRSESDGGFLGFEDMLD